MKTLQNRRESERGSAAIKVLVVFIILGLAAHAGFNYVPVAYEGASFRQEMDTAVVKALGSSGRMKPLEVVTASMNKAIRDHNIPDDAVVEIKPVQGAVVEAHVAYQRQVNMLPFGMYKYTYAFEHTARPVGYLLKE